MAAKCEIPGCVSPAAADSLYCAEHLGTGAVVDKLDTLSGVVDQAVEQLDRIRRDERGSAD